MKCSNCGTSTVADQQFCRSCGSSLGADEPRRFRPPNTLGLVALILLFCGLLTSLTGKMIEVRWVMFAGAFLMVGGMFAMMVFAYIWDTRPRKKRTARTIQMPTSLPAADTTNKLKLPGGTTDFIPSATERTTNLLETPVSSNAR